MMTKETLLVFIQKILEGSSQEKAYASLCELEQILKEQNVPNEFVRLVEQTALSIPEANEVTKTKLVTEENLKIAIQRADERRRREEAARNHGRC